MKTTNSILYASLAALSAAAPAKSPNKRTTQNTCEQYGEFTLNPYTISNNLWGEANGSGSQCLNVDGLTDGSLSWSTSWSWANNKDDVKSYANAVVNFTKTQLSGISSMKSKWEWSYSGTSVSADVAYDMFTSSTGGGSEEYEVMVWLAALGEAGPISTSYSASGDAEPIDSTTIAGNTFSVYKGSNGVQTVFSFVPSTNITSYSGDLRAFFNYLISSQSFDESQWLVSVGAGTEAFLGTNAVFTTTSYSMDIDTGSDTSSSSTASSSSAIASATSTATTVSSSSAAATMASYAATISSVAATSSMPTSYSASSSSYLSASAPASISVATYSTAVSSGPTGYSAPASSSSNVAAPTSSSAPGSGDCHVEYVYV